MAELQMTMKFERLPNEIFLDLFEYFDIFDIFHSFDKLNNHFNQLIRTIPLHINFEHISKSMFDRICRFLSFHGNAKKQVYSLKLSNQDTCDQINNFFSFFSLNEFIHLHSLTLIQVNNDNLVKLKSMLPLTSELLSFHLIDSNDITRIDLPNFYLQTLSIPTLQTIRTSLNHLSFITTMTISGCSLDQLLHQLFKYASMLKYLQIFYFSQYYTWSTNYHSDDVYQAIHLKQIKIFHFDYEFKDFEKLAKSMPKLTILELYGRSSDRKMMEANRWKCLIESLLPHLDIFKFSFSLTHRNEIDHLRNQLNQFQTDFWHQQHHWYTEYVLSEHLASIYAIPYMLNSYVLGPYFNIYSNQLLNTFDHVTNLILYRTILKESCPYYFPNITSLTILPSDECYRPRLGGQAFRTLKTVANLSKIKHLSISFKFYIKEPLALLKFLQEMPQLSSLSISIRMLENFFYNTDLSEYLNVTIKKLDIYKSRSYSYTNRYELEKFCRKFSNLEQLKCNINQVNDILYLLHHLSKLTYLKAYLLSINDYEYFRSWFTKQTRKLNLLFHIKSIDKRETELCIWIDQKTN